MLDYDDEVNLALAVTDLARSVEFFGTHLGFSTRFVDDKNGWATIETPFGGVTLGLSARETVETGGGATPTFGVKDIGAARKRLEDAGVRFGGPTVEIPGVTKFATFFDPDGNAFMLAEKAR